MELNAEIVEDVREMVSAGQKDELASVSWDNETLAGALHLACFETEVLSNSSAAHIISETLDRWEIALPMLKQARRAMRSRGVWDVPLSMASEALDWEILPVPLEEQVTGLIWAQFQMRFRRAMIDKAFKGSLPIALVGALHEMADNALRHSGASVKKPAPGAVGYIVRHGQMTFVVVDAGRGVLQSLRTNPTLPQFANDAEALNSAILGRATSDEQKEMGDGFEHVHRALSDWNGHLRFRSGSAALQMDGRGQDRQINPRYGMPRAAGFQLAVHCVLDQVPVTEMTEI